MDISRDSISIPGVIISQIIRALMHAIERRANYFRSRPRFKPRHEIFSHPFCPFSDGLWSGVSANKTHGTGPGQLFSRVTKKWDPRELCVWQVINSFSRQEASPWQRISESPERSGIFLVSSSNSPSSPIYETLSYNFPPCSSCLQSERFLYLLSLWFFIISSFSFLNYHSWLFQSPVVIIRR